MNRPIVAVVLAGGVGSRFWPISKHKIAFPFFHKPFFEYSVGSVLPPEVTKVVIVATNEIKEEFKNLSLSMPMVTVVQRNPLGMADALLTAESEIRDSSLLVIIADDLVDASIYKDVIAKANKTKAFAVLPGWKTPYYFPGGYLTLKENKILDIEEKPEAGREPSNYVNITGHFFADSNTLLSALKETKSDTDDVYEKTLTSLMSHQDFQLSSYDGPFASLKYAWDILSIMDQMLKHLKVKKGNNIEIRQHVVIEGAVVIGDNVRIFENTKIVGPTYIGANTIVGNNSIIRQSHIGDNCIVGFNTDITRSYIGDNCWFHSNYIGDSVLEENISLGSGSVLANLRLDEGHILSTSKGEKINTYRNKLGAVIGKDVRIGVNVSIMPGVKVGARSYIGAGITLDRDLPDECFCVGTTEYAISKNLKPITSNRDEFKKHI